MVAILDLLNHAAIFWTYCQKPAQALKFLEQAQNNFQKYTGALLKRKKTGTAPEGVVLSTLSHANDL